MEPVKVGDWLLLTEELNKRLSFIEDSHIDATIQLKAGMVFTVATVDWPEFTVTLESSFLKNYSFAFDLVFSDEDLTNGRLRRLQIVEEVKPPEVTPMPPEREAASFKLSSYSAKKGRNRPSANIFQLVATELANRLNKPEWALTADGIFGSGTEKIAKEIQTHFNLTADGVVGGGTWGAITPSLESWRPALRLRIAECQCSWEAGSNTYGYHGIIPSEGWWNYGIWNVNKGSAKTLTTYGGASYLHSKIDYADQLSLSGDAPASEVGDWFGMAAGRETQIGSYFLKQVLRPSIKNLVGAGWDIALLGFSSLDELDAISTSEEVDAHLAMVAPFHERLILAACDVTVNSGAGGYYPQKSPRCWDSSSVPWPAEQLPFKEECKQAFAQAFGGTISSDTTYLTSDTRETYKQALNQCLWQICQTDEQRIMLTGELQARCVIDAWRDAVIERRRAASWKDGHRFQGSFYCMLTSFGIGI